MLRGLARDDVRLLVASEAGTIRHARFHDLPEQLAPGDLVVVNNSATVAGEIDAVVDGAPVVLHAATRLPDGTWVVELRSWPHAAEPVLDARPGQTVGVGELAVTLLTAYPRTGSPTDTGNRLWRARVEGDLRRLLDRRGRPIAYGYLERRNPLSAYQSSTVECSRGRGATSGGAAAAGAGKAAAGISPRSSHDPPAGTAAPPHGRPTGSYERWGHVNGGVVQRQV